MDSGFYAACSGLVAKTRQLEAAAHNVANASTTAFKARRLTFQSILASSNGELSQLNEAINRYGLTGDLALNTSGGTLERTGNELDIAIEGPGYLAVQAAGQIGYTRNGHLRLSAQNQLLADDGQAILGEQGPIRIPPNTRINISPDGTISANGALVGKLRLVEFGTDPALKELQSGIFATDSIPVAARRSVLRQGSLEASNVNGIEAAVGLIAIQRHAEMLQRAMNIFHSEFNRIATAELSRV